MNQLLSFLLQIICETKMIFVMENYAKVAHSENVAIELVWNTNMLAFVTKLQSC